MITVMVAATILIFMLVIAIHELGHAYAMKRLGIRVSEVSIGLPTQVSLSLSISWLPCEKITFTPILLGGYTRIDPLDEGKYESLSYAESAVVNGAGIWANLLSSTALFVAISVNSQHQWKQKIAMTGIASLMAVLLWYGQKIICAYVVPIISVGAAALVVYTSFFTVPASQKINFVFFDQPAFLIIALVLSILLAFFNTVPLMPLDGGRIAAKIIKAWSQKAASYYEKITYPIFILWFLISIIKMLVLSFGKILG